MLRSSSRSRARQEPSWTQSPSTDSRSDPAWHERSAAIEPSRLQGSAPRPSSRRIWISSVVAVVGLGIVMLLLLRMASVVEEHVARNQSGQAAAPRGSATLAAGSGSAVAVQGQVK